MQPSHTKYHLIKGFDTIYASLYLIFGGFFGSKYYCANCFSFSNFFRRGLGELHIYMLKEHGGHLE